MSNKPYSLTFQADFSTMIRDATRVGQKLEGIFKSAAEVGFSSKGIQKIQNKVEDMIKRERKLREEIEVRIARQRADEEGRLHTERTHNARKLAELNRKLNDDTIDEETKKKLKAERELAKVRYDVFREEEDFIDNMRKASKELLGTVRGMERSADKAKAMSHYFERTAHRVSNITKFFNGEMKDGADQFIEKLSDGLDGLAGKLTGSIDMAALFKGGAGMASKGITAAGDALGSMIPILGTVGTLLGGVVAIAGVVGAVFFEADKKVKEFNKTAINTFGVMDMARMNGGNLNSTLMMLNRTVHDLSGNLGITHDEAMGLLDALDRGGITLSQLTSRTISASAQQAELTRQIVAVGTTARMMGVSVGDYANTLTEYVNDLGASLETVNDSFANIAKMASESSFGTRRFYTMVTQASSGQASLNTRMEDTAELLIKMTKVLGAKKAMETVGAHQNDLSNMSTQDRYRLIITSGAGNVRKNIAREATHQGRNFAREAASNANVGALRSSAIEARAGGEVVSAIEAASRNDATPAAVEHLTKVLREMPRDTANRLSASLGSRNNGLGRQLAQLTQLSRGTSGRMEDMSDALGSMSAGGSIVARLNGVRALSGQSLDQMQGPQRMMAESTLGISGQQFDNLAAVARDARGQFDVIKDMIKSGRQFTPAANRDLTRRYGVMVDSNNQIRSSAIGESGDAVSTGDIISTVDDMITASVNLNGEDAINARTAQEMLMQQTFDATVSIGDILENKIYQVLLDIAGWGTPLMQALAKIIGGDAAAEVAAASQENVQALTRGILDHSKKISVAQSQLQSVNTEYGTARGEKKAALAVKKTQLEADIERLQRDRTDIMTVRDRIRGGNNVDIRAGYRNQDRGQGINNPGGDRTIYQDYRQAREASPNANITEVIRDSAGVVDRVLGAAASARDRARENAPRPTEEMPEVSQVLGSASNAAPTSTPQAANAAPVAVATAPRDTNPTSTDAVTTAVADASDTAAAANADAARRSENAANSRQRAGQQHMTQLLTRETKLGDALARSRLPDAIVEAQLRQQVMALGTAAGLTPEQSTNAVNQFMSEGTLTPEFSNALSSHPELEVSGALAAVGIGNMQARTANGGRFRRRPQETQAAEDFIYRGNGGAGSITPIDTADQFVGLRPGGAIDQAVNGRPGVGGGQGGGGGVYHIHVHGGDEQRTFGVVKRVLDQIGVRPARGS